MLPNMTAQTQPNLACQKVVFSRRGKHSINRIPRKNQLFFLLFSRLVPCVTSLLLLELFDSS